MSPRMPGTKRSRPGGVFLSGQAVSLLGDGLAVLAIPLLVLDLSRDPLALALSAASVTVGYLVVGLPAGVLVDRMDPWRVLVLMDAVRALLFAGLFAFASAGKLTVWLILLIAFAAGACAVFFQTALVVVVKDQFAPARLIRANSVLELANQLSLVAGPAVVGGRAAPGGGPRAGGDGRSRRHGPCGDRARGASRCGPSAGPPAASRPSPSATAA